MRAGRAEPPPGRALVPGQHHHHPYITIIRYLARVRGESGLVPAAFIEIIARCSLDLFYLVCSFAFVKGQSSGFFPQALLKSTCSPDNGALPDVPGPLRSCSPQTLERSGDNADGLARGQRLLKSLQPRDAEAEELFV